MFFMSDIENTEEKRKSQITINKSTYNRLIIAIISVGIVSAFMIGYFVGTESVEPQEVIIRESAPIAKPQPTTQEQIGPKILKNISLDDDPMKGNPDAEITIVEFSDFQCPFCAKFHESTLPMLEKEYISTGKVNFVYRDFPIQSIHPNAIPAALASECADDQGKFWEMHDLIFLNQNVWKNLSIAQAVSLFKQYSAELEIESNEFSECMDSGKHIEEIGLDLNDGRNYGVSGTPGFFVGNNEIGFVELKGAQPFSSFQRVIEGQLSR